MNFVQDLNRVIYQDTNKQKIQAYTEADKLYGATEDPNTFGFDEILNTLIAGSMDRGAPAYTKSYLDLMRAKEKNRLTIGD